MLRDFLIPVFQIIILKLHLYDYLFINQVFLKKQVSLPERMNHENAGLFRPQSGNQKTVFSGKRKFVREKTLGQSG